MQIRLDGPTRILTQSLPRDVHGAQCEDLFLNLTQHADCPSDYWAYWTSDLLAPPLASTVSSVMSLGFTARETIPIVFCGFALCSIVITLTGKMGATYAVPFPVIVRSIFGMYGSYPAICLRAFVAAMWTAILCVQAGDFLGNCITAIWPSFASEYTLLPQKPHVPGKLLGVRSNTSQTFLTTCRKMLVSPQLGY
jgi:hypothetical protein